MSSVACCGLAEVGVAIMVQRSSTRPGLKAALCLGPTLCTAAADPMLKHFRRTARREAGYQLCKAQIVKSHPTAKPVTSVGPGVRETRIRQVSGAYWIIYVRSSAMRFMCATFPE